jgi:hypothetical protein
MKNIFSYKLYLQGLRKIRTAGVAMAIVIFVLTAWIPINCITSGGNHGRYVTSVDAGMFAPFGFLLMFFAPLLVYNMFSFLNERKGSDFFHSLPQKRICTYLSFMSAIMTWIASVLLVSSLVNTVLWALADGYVLKLKAVLLTLLGFMILAMVMAGFMMLSMTVTGTAISNCLVFLLFFLFIRACGLFFLYGFSEITDMFHVNNSLLRVFDWDFFLPLGLLIQVFDGDADVFGNIWFFIYWLTVAIVLFAVAAWTYCRRRSESATKSAPNRFMQNLYRIGVTFPFLMISVYLMIVDIDFYLSLFCVFVAFLVWVIFELMTTKKVKNVVRTLPLFLIPVVLAGSYAASLYLVRGIFFAAVPERDNIKYVQLDCNSGMVGSLDRAILVTTKITDSDVIDKVYEAIEQTVESADLSRYERQAKGYIFNETLTLTLKSGRKVTYNLYSSHNLFTILESSDDVQSQSVFMYEGEVDRVSGHKLTSDESLIVWEALREDYRNMTEEQRETYQRLNKHQTADIFSISIYASYRGQGFTQRYIIDAKYTPEAMAAFVKYANYNPVGELSSARYKIRDLGANSIQYAYMSVQNYTYGESYLIQTQDFKAIKEFLMGTNYDSHLLDYQNESVYHVYLEIELKTSSSVYDSFRMIRADGYVTLSDEDIARLNQILNYPTMPISEN